MTATALSVELPPQPVDKLQTVATSILFDEHQHADVDQTTKEVIRRDACHDTCPTRIGCYEDASGAVQRLQMPARPSRWRAAADLSLDQGDCATRHQLYHSLPRIRHVIVNCKDFTPFSYAALASSNLRFFEARDLPLAETHTLATVDCWLVQVSS